MAAESADVVIVGAGPAGSLVASELAERGVSVIVLEAGRRFEAADLPNREANAGQILWTEPRVYAGTHAVVPKAGIGVGGGTLAWLGVMPRFHPARLPHPLHRGRRRRLAARLRRPAAVLREGRARVRRGGRVRSVRAGALHAADAAAPHELARARCWLAARASSARIRSRRRSPSTRSPTTAVRRASTAAGAARVAPPGPRPRPPTPTWRARNAGRAGDQRGLRASA